MYQKVNRDFNYVSIKYKIIFYFLHASSIKGNSFHGRILNVSASPN